MLIFLLDKKASKPGILLFPLSLTFLTIPQKVLRKCILVVFFVHPLYENVGRPYFSIEHFSMISSNPACRREASVAKILSKKI